LLESALGFGRCLRVVHSSRKRAATELRRRRFSLSGPRDCAAGPSRAPPPEWLGFSLPWFSLYSRWFLRRRRCCVSFLPKARCRFPSSNRFRPQVSAPPFAALISISPCLRLETAPPPSCGSREACALDFPPQACRSCEACAVCSRFSAAGASFDKLVRSHEACPCVAGCTCFCRSFSGSATAGVPPEARSQSKPFVFLVSCRKLQFDFGQHRSVSRSWISYAVISSASMSCS
jgi:hypothetical protein